MTEVLGAVSSSVSLLKETYKFIDGFYHAIDDRKEYMQEVAAVQVTLERFKKRMEKDGVESSVPAEILACFYGIEPIIKGLHKKVKDLSEATKSDQVGPRTKRVAFQEKVKHFSEKARLNEAGIRTKWVAIQAGVRNDIEAIYRRREPLKEYLDELRIDRIDDTLHQNQREQRLKEIMPWLSPLQSLQKQKSIYGDTFLAGEWLMAMDEWKHWAAGKFDAYMWLYGDPGVGKTVLAAQLTEHLRNTHPADDILVFDLFIDYKETTMQTISTLVGSLLKQLVEQGKNELASGILEELYEKSQTAAEPDPQEVVELFLQETKRYERVYIIVDSWNGLLENVQQQLAKRLRELSQSKSRNVSVCITSRYAESETAQKWVNCINCDKTKLKIHSYCTRCSDYKFCIDCAAKGFSCGHTDHVMRTNDRVEIEVKASDEDIRSFVKWELDRGLTAEADRYMDEDVGAISYSTTALERTLAADPELLEKVTAEVVKSSRGNYQLAKLYIDDIKSMPTLKHMDDALQQLPEDLPAAYRATMERLFKQKKWQRKLVKFALYWITCTKRRLSLAEMQQAFDIEIDSSEYEEDKLFHQAELVHTSSGLIYVEFDKSAVKVHMTLDQFLHENRATYFEPEVDKDAAMRLLTCLNYEAMEVPCNNDAAIDARLTTMPLLSYACQYWAEHVRLVETEFKVRKALIRFLSHPGKVASYMEINYRLSSARVADFDVRKGVNGLHLAARFGFDSVIPKLSAKFGVDSTDDKYGQTALMYAARYGHVKTVQKLLEHGASANIESNRGSTALFECYAGMRKDQNPEHAQGYYDTFIELIEVENIDLNARNEQELQQTILMLASRYGDDDLVDSLSRREGVDVNIVDRDGNSALIHAVFSGNPLSVQYLLQTPFIDVNIANNSGLTALRWTMSEVLNQSSRVGIFKLLLENGANPMSGDIETGTMPLLGAIQTGDLYIFETLLKHSSALDVLDTKSRNLLHLVCSNKGAKVEMVQQVIDSGRLPIDGVTARGQTPMHCACRVGSDEIVRILIDAGADTSKKDSAGRTPADVAMQYASERSHLQILHLLDHTAEGEPESDPVEAHASELPCWSLPIVDLFEELERRIAAGNASLADRDPDTGNTAFHFSVEHSRTEFLELLADAGSDEQKFLSNDRGRTPLHIAAYNGDVKAAEILLRATDVPLEAEDKNEHTAIWYALQNGRTQNYNVAVKMLAKGAAIDASDAMHLQKTFEMAVKLREAKVADYLISKGADHLRIDEDGLTAKMIARDNDDVDMLRVLDRNKSMFVPIRPSSGEGKAIKPSTNEKIGQLPLIQEDQERPAKEPDLSKPAFKTRPRALEIREAA